MGGVWFKRYCLEYPSQVKLANSDCTAKNMGHFKLLFHFSAVVSLPYPPTQASTSCNSRCPTSGAPHKKAQLIEANVGLHNQTATAVYRA
jgi:hypothetical protein